MKSIYQKYYDALKGKDFVSKVGNYKSALSNSKDKLSSIESTIGSSQWVEKGLEIIKSSVIPSLNSQSTQLENGFDALSQASSKVNELVNQLTELDSLEKKLESLGNKWTYVEDGPKSKTEVNNHNYEISQCESKISTQESLINSTINAINSISFNYSSQKSAFSGYISNLKEATKTPPSGVLDCIAGVQTDAGRNARLLGKVAVILDFTCDGQHLGQDGCITIKKGTTAHLKVRIPDDVTGVEQIIRTSADGKQDANGRPVWTNWVSQQVTPKAVKKDTSTWFNGREYDWYITGNNTTGDGYITLSQTALFKAPNTPAAVPQGSYKGMARLKVKVVD